MNYKWLIGIVLFSCAVFAQWPPAATYMSEEQLEATSDLFRRRKALPVPLPGDLCDDLERIAKDVEKVREALCE